MNVKSKKCIFYIGIPVVILLILLRFGLAFFRSDGFSGMSLILPVLLLCFSIFALITSVCFMAWVYQDCKRRGDDPILWSIVVFVATPFIGLLIYFQRRSEIKQNCPACGHRVSLRAKYCEECGGHIEDKEKLILMERKGTHHLRFIVAGTISMILMLTCLVGFIVNVAAGDNFNTNVAANEKVWNLGAINMNYNSYRDGVWKLDFKSASNGFIKQEDMEIEDADTQMLYADISCGTVPDGSTLVLWLVQNDIVQFIDVTDLSEPIEYSLAGFENGKIHVRLQINGVEDTTSEIYIR